MKLIPDMKAFGNRAWGIAIACFIIVATNSEYTIWIRIIASLPMIYFFWFGDSRFTDEYKKII